MGGAGGPQQRVFSWHRVSGRGSAHFGYFHVSSGIPGIPELRSSRALHPSAHRKVAGVEGARPSDPCWAALGHSGWSARVYRESKTNSLGSRTGTCVTPERSCVRITGVVHMYVYVVSVCGLYVFRVASKCRVVHGPVRGPLRRNPPPPPPPPLTPR